MTLTTVSTTVLYCD